MSLIAALRQQYPEYESYSDEEITSFLSGSTSTPAPEQGLLNSTQEDRTWGEAVSDTGKSIMGGFANLGGDLAEIVDTGANLVGVDVDLGIGDAANRAADYWQNQKSDELKEAYSQLGAADGFIETLAAVAARPELIPDIISGSLPYLLPTGAVARAVKGAKAGATAVAATGGMLEGANASREAKKEVDNLTPEQLAEGSEQYRQMVASGMSEDEAKEIIRQKTGLTALAFTAPIAMLAGKMSGAARLETDFFTGKGVGNGAGRFGSVLARESGEEIIQEGSNALGSNLGVQTYADDSQDLSEGVGQSAALGMIAGAGQAAPMAALQGFVPPVQKASEEIAKAGEEAAAAGGDALDQTVAKSKAQSELTPSAVAESKKQDYAGFDEPAVERQANAGPQPQNLTVGIDQDIATARRLGFEEEVLRLTNVKRVYQRAERRKLAGDIEGANKDIERANAIHQDVLGNKDQLSTESTANFPIPFVSEGEVLGGDLAAVNNPNWTQPEAPIDSASNEIIPELGLSGAKLPPGTEEINLGREYAPPQAQPVDPLYDRVGENIVHRQAPVIGLPQPGVSQEQIIDIQNQERVPAQDMAGIPLDQDWSAFAADTETKGVPRSDMPQIKAEHRGAMTNFMNARGIAHEQQEVLASELKPTQAEFSHAKVKKAMEYKGGDRSILVSSDGYVLDGHHQWLAKRELGQSIKIIRLDAPIDKLIPLAHEFPSSEVDGGASSSSVSNTAESETQADLSVENEKQTTDQAQRSESPKTVTAPTNEQEAQAQPANKIEDFGEKIGGARKDEWAGFRESLADEIDTKTVPLSKSFPEPDYKKLSEAGADPEALALIALLRNSIPSKPRKSSRVKSWADKVDTIKGFAKDLMDGTTPPQMVRDMMLKTGEDLGSLARASSVIAKADPALMKEAAKYKITAGSYSYFRGQKFDNPKRMFMVEKNGEPDWDNAFESQEEAEAHLLKLLQNTKPEEKGKTKARKSALGVYTNRRSGKVFIGWKGASGVLNVQDGFDSPKEARAYLNENRDEVEAKLAEIKSTPSMRRSENNRRSGPERRQSNVTPELFADTFGFRGVEFGNWVENSKRQQDLNETYDGLIDLAEILDIPPKALSLNGELGLAFGARGKGGKGSFAAHYEAGKIVINLTKKAGPGSLAHEWWHSMDNYFSRMRNDKHGFTTDRPYELMDKSVRPEVLKAFKGVMQSIQMTDLPARAAEIDKTRSKAYWATNVELSARAFESFVIDKLKSSDINNDYLANVVSEEAWGKTETVQGSYPYPTEAELESIKASYQKLFDVIETKETDSGVAMFSRLQKPVELKDEGDIARIKTGKPVTFYFTHNTESATGIFGIPDKDSDYGRGYEPSARFVSVTSKKRSEEVAREWPNHIGGKLTFMNPLVVPNDRIQWKKALSDQYGGLTGKKLSKALIADGYDGVITTEEKYITETIDLTTFDESIAKYSRRSISGAGNSNNASVLSVDAVEAVASNIARRLKLRGVSINTVATETDLPASILKQAAEHGAEGEIGAVLHQGSIYLVADKMPDATAVETAIWHESAHYGGRTVFGKDIVKAYRKLAMRLGGVKGIKAKTEELGVADLMAPYFQSAKGMKSDAASVYLIDELLSHANQLQASEKLPAKIKRTVQEFFGAIRDMLRRWNFKELPELTNSDLAFLLKQINKAAQEGEGSVDAPQFMRVSESDELSMFFADLASTIDEQPAFSRAGRVGSDRADWSDFPDVIFQASLGATKEHPDYEAAKSGDAEAAVNVVKSVLNEDSINQIKGVIGDSQPIVVPVIAQEKTGANMLPLTYAHALASKLGLSVDVDIMQSIKASHTDAKAFHRIGVQAVFDGNVEPGAEYIIVDDTMAMGGTLANLRGHIEANGGKVVMASALTGFPSASKIGVSDKLKSKLLDKHGDELNEYLQSEFGFGIDSLTQGEAGHLNASPSIDAIRERISEAQDAAGINLSGDSEVLDTAFSRVANPEEQSNRSIRSTVRDVIDSWRFQVQDKFIDLKRKQQEIGDVDDEANAYQKAAIWEGKAGEQLNDFDEQRVQPLLEQVAETGLDLDQVGEWLVARHAEEANEYLAEINPDKSEDERYRLSGMSNDEAASILDQHQDNAELQELGETIDQINRDRVSMLVDRGLISQSDADAWQGRYEHYVPLKREEADEGFLPSRGQGFSMKGKESKQRTGSAYWTPGKILSNVIANYEQSIIRSEKNEVGKALLKFVEQNPDDNFWTVVTDRKRSEVRNGKVIEVTDNREGPADFSVKVDGVQYMIEFNTSNEKSKRLVEGLKNLQVSEMGSVMRGLASVTRFLATINTSWNPEFMVSNFFRDAQTAAYNLSDTELKDMEGRVLKDIFPAMNGIRNALFGDGSSEWADVWEDFRKSGGKTGWLDLHSDIQAKEKDLKKMVKRLQDGKSSKMAIMRFIKGVEDMNNVIENAVRLSAYKHALEAGLSKDKAAALAKDLTVNFNRKGNKGPMINAMYMFFNAAIQGNVRLLQAMTHSRKGRALALSTVGFAVMLDMINRSLSGEDDDGENIYDTLPDHVKDRNIIIMGEKEPIVKIPAPWGYNVLHVLGQEIGSAINNDRFDPLESGSRAVMSVADAFNPVGSGTFLQMVSPTVLDPAVQIGENKNFFGSPLKPEHTFDAFRPRPEYQMHFSNARDTSKDLTKWLNDVSGGNEVRPGAINWSPEVVDMLWDTITGGLGRTVADTGDFAGKVISGDELEVSRIPFVRKVTGANIDYGVKGRYYEWSRDIGYASQELKQLKGEDLYEARRSPQFKLIGLHKATEKKLRSLRKTRKALVKNNASEERIEKIDENIRKVMAQFNKQYAKAVYKG